MISRSRRKRQITAQKQRLTSTDSRGAVSLAVVLLVSLIGFNAAYGQEPVADFRTDGYSPPVHIPPRVPLYDPGLPETLNGKFNSTQRIQSGSDSGFHTVISDDPDSAYEQDSSFRQSDRVFLRNDTVIKQGYRRSVQPVRQSTSRKRRAGLQDKISGLFAGNGKVNASNRNVSRGGPAFSQRVATNRQQQQFTERPTTNENRRLPFNERLAKSLESFQPGNLIPTSNSNSQQIESVQFQRPQARQRSETSDSSQNRLVRNEQHSRPSTQNRRHPHPQHRNSIRDVQMASMQEQTDKQQNFVQHPRIDNQSNAVDDPQFANEFFAEPFDESAFPSNDEQVSSPRAHAREFKKNLRTRTAQQPQLPVAKSVVDKPANPVSVLRKRNEDISLEPGSGFNRNIDLSSPSSLEPGEFMEPVNSGPAFNVLRESGSFQDDENIDSGLAADDEEQLESPFTDEEESADGDQNPLRKSCEEFRAELLNDPITDIALDISPRGKTELLGDNVYRTWRDQNGNELAQGTIADLRRGYVIIDSSNGGQVRLPYARLSDADWLAISDYWRLPIECGLGSGVHVARCWVPQTATWHASALCHKPLYFENIQLERYGHSHGPFIQPAASAVHFFSKLFFLPYNTAINRQNECQYALGFYRPGNCAPWLKDPFPISLRGAARQTLVYTGVGYLAQ